MHMNTTDRLRLLAKNSGYIIWETRFPYGELKQDVIMMKDATGKYLEFTDSNSHCNAKNEVRAFFRKSSLS